MIALGIVTCSLAASCWETIAIVFSQESNPNALSASEAEDAFFCGDDLFRLLELGELSPEAERLRTGRTRPV